MRGVLSLEFLGDQSPLGDGSFLYGFFFPADERGSFPMERLAFKAGPHAEPTRMEKEERKTKFGDMMLVHYEGYLEKDGSLFHSTHKHNNGQPTWFTLGIKEVIQGWDKGLTQMCVGEKRKLTVPPSLGYGKEGKGKIPPESTLIFNIDLLEIRNGPRSHESFQEMDLNDDWKLSKEEVRTYLKKEFERHGAPINASHHDTLVEDIFDKEDEDSDGFISAREFVYKHDEL